MRKSLRDSVFIERSGGKIKYYFNDGRRQIFVSKAWVDRKLADKSINLYDPRH